MGIQNLLPFVAKACRQSSIDEFAGCSVAVDVSCLLHKGLFGCMDQIATGQDTNFYVYYVKKHIDILVGLGCHVIMVFDGQPLPAKKDTADGRRLRREENMRQGEILLSQGRSQEATKKFQQGTTITADVVQNTIQFFRDRENVDVIVSPYESDAQLAFLTREGLADVVITEDSDLIAFECEKIIFKWDVKGPCTVYEKKNLPLCFSGKMATDFDFTTFRRICILTGCDYLVGLKGVGLSKSLNFFSKTSRSDLRTLLPRVPSYLKMPKLKVTKEFVEDFIRAEKTFQHQVVFDPRQRCQRPLTPYPVEDSKHGDEMDEDFITPLSSQDSFEYAGVVVSASQSTRLALGNSSQSASQISDIFRLPSAIPDWSIWSDKFELGSKKKEKRANEENEEKKRKKKDLGAFVLDSPERRQKKKTTTVTEVELLSDEEEFVITKTKKKASTPNKKRPPAKKIVTTTARTVVKNQAAMAMSAEDLMKMYMVDEVMTTTIEEKKEENDEMKEDEKGEIKEELLPLPDKNRKRHVEEEMDMDIENGLLPVIDASPIPHEGHSITDETNSPSGLNTSTPLRKLGSGLKNSAYFMKRSSCANPFKKPRILDPLETPPTPLSDISTSSTPSRLNQAIINTPKSTSLVDSMREKLDMNDSPKSPFLRPGCRPVGLRRAMTK